MESGVAAEFRPTLELPPNFWKLKQRSLLQLEALSRQHMTHHRMNDGRSVFALQLGGPIATGECICTLNWAGLLINS